MYEILRFKKLDYQPYLHSVFKNNTCQTEGPHKIIFSILSSIKCEYIYFKDS